MRKSQYRLTPNGEYQPIAMITFRAPGAPPIDARPVEAMLDTGSTWTFVPQDIAEEVNLPPAGQERVGFLDGKGNVYQARWAVVGICGKEVGTRVLVFTHDEQAEGLVGRDVLRHLALVFDGPAREWRVLDVPQTGSQDDADQ